MSWKLKSALGAAALLLATAQFTFYEGEAFRGRVFSTGKTVGDSSRTRSSDRASSVIVYQVPKPGSHVALGGTRLENQFSSVRPVNAEPLSAAYLGYPIGSDAAPMPRSP